MDECVSLEPNSGFCGGRGTACLTNTSEIRCACNAHYTGFGDLHPFFDNCDIYIPIVYFLGGLILLTDVVILAVVAWAIKQRTVRAFLSLLKAKNVTAILTVLGFVVAVCESLWVASRLWAVDSRVIGDDPFTTVFFSIAVSCIYVMAPHVLKHYAKLTFSDARLMTLNVIGREKARRQQSLFRPLLDVLLPVCAVIGAFGPCISINNPSLVRIGIYIISIFTSIFLSLTLVLIVVLINPMLRDMRLAVSMNRLNSTDQSSLVVATRKLALFQKLIVFVSFSYIPVMLIWGFAPALYGTITYIYFLGAWFCACICAGCIYTLTNVTRQQSTTTSSSQSNAVHAQAADIQIEPFTATSVKADGVEGS